MKLSLGFSPCPNDTFIFDAMVHGKIDTEGLAFDVLMADVEELNKKAFAKELDITKLSYHAFAYLLEDYLLLDAGSALGTNCGPLLIGKRMLSEREINSAKIAIPGKLTTANFLLSLAFPNATNRCEMLFSEIEDSILENGADAGLIIHENRFTYGQKGLVKIIDLGEFWESTTGLPIPLGGIAIKNSFPKEILQKVNRIMKRSVSFAMDNPAHSKKFVQKYAQEMEAEVLYKHIKLYVNSYTKDLGIKGKAAVSKLFKMAFSKGITPTYIDKLFIN